MLLRIYSAGLGRESRKSKLQELTFFTVTHHPRARAKQMERQQMKADMRKEMQDAAKIAALEAVQRSGSGAAQQPIIVSQGFWSAGCHRCNQKHAQKHPLWSPSNR